MSYDEEIAKKHDLNIHWPEDYDPFTHSDYVFVHNEIHINAPPKDVFSWLVNAKLWSSYYDNAHDLQIISQQDKGEAGTLRLGTKFSWSTFGVHIESKVLIFEEDSEILWDGKRLGLDVCHGWKLYPKDDGASTFLVTEEVQSELLAQINAIFLPHRMYNKHQEWLAGLKRMAETNGALNQQQQQL